ncbi:hypothetical protein [Rhodopirellula bahusiensis]|uniref:Uncharacterized protein n=1 Tax=Rhodopirellula bahusiensis TaxID=2014065 RepID=A0A2G1W8C8_9BACT|nr:hypothetical protein [Rhodopirellula bahusiensis]PHQ35268.1 hypothetical protein CEE69_09510 [Rhodopirellula bahusiensis]
MNAAESRSGPRRPGGKKGKQTTVAGIVIAVVIGGYTLLRPSINEATGWNLPALPGKQVAKDSVAENSPSPVSDQTANPRSVPKPAESSKSSPSRGEAKTQPQRNETAKSPGPLASKMTRGDPDSRADSASAQATQDTSDLKYGLLREIGTDRFMSPAGVLYTPGSAEGHRLEHLRRHTKDQPNRSGKHGVFDGEMEGALATIDKAYEKAQANQRTTKEVDGKRTIYTVDMGKRVGFVGGRDGQRSRNPMARRVRLVLEGNRLITAFPL